MPQTSIVEESREQSLGDLTDRNNMKLLAAKSKSKEIEKVSSHKHVEKNIDYQDHPDFGLKEDSESLTEKIEAKSNHEIKVKTEIINIEAQQRPVT